MHRILIISKDGTETMHYTRVQNATELYRPAGVRVSPSFCQCAVWPTPSSNTELRIYGKAEGPERYANAYICPPPFEHLKLFGTCIVAQVEIGDSNLLHDIDIDAWKNLRFTTEASKTLDTSTLKPTIPLPPIEHITSTSTTIDSNVIAPEIIDTYLNCAIELNYEPYLPDN